MDPAPGPGEITEIKQYRLLRELGRGAMGAVYEATDNRDGSRVAVKILHPWLAASDPSFRDRFEREAHIAALLRSPYTVHLLDFGMASGTYFLVMEFVEGTTLADEIRKGPMDPARALRIAADVARALEEANARGVVHRDIKPDNVLLTTEGRVKVADFGIARQESSAGLTAVGGFVGTPSFAAPEQAMGETDHRSDIYSLGVTLYSMLAGHPPFRGTTAWDTLRMHQEHQLPMAPLAHLPDSVTNPVRRCLEKDPRDRYQTAAELAGALERASASLGTRSHQPPRAPVGHDSSTRGYSEAAPPTAPTAKAAEATPPPQAARPLTRTVAATEMFRESPSGGAPPTAPASPVPAAPQATPAAVAPAAAPGVRMALTQVASDAPGTTRFALQIVNGGHEPVAVTLAASEPSHTLSVTVPPGTELAPGASAQLPVEVRQVEAAAPGRPVQFQVRAAAAGRQVAFANASVMASPSAGRRGGRILLMAVALGLLVVAGVAVAFVALSGNGDETPLSPDTPATAAVPTAATSTSSAARPSIRVLERWDYAFTITENTCPFGARPGDRYGISFRFEPVAGGAQSIADGDQVRVIGVQDGRAIAIGTFTFRVDDFEFTYPTGEGAERGTAVLRTTFRDEVTIGDAALTERYDTAGGCTITARPAS